MNINNYILQAENNEFYVEYLYTIESYLTFYIKIKSGDFIGSSNFCISKNDLELRINTLSTMDKKLEGDCTISDNDSDAFISLVMKNLGHVSIYGQIGGSHNDHNMKFRYITDQTILKNLIQCLKAVL